MPEDKPFLACLSGRLHLVGNGQEEKILKQWIFRTKVQAIWSCFDQVTALTERPDDSSEMVVTFEQTDVQPMTL
jgi:hypothetical protein